MAKSKVPAHIVQPTRALTADQLREQAHFAHRSGAVPAKRRTDVRGNRSAARRAAIAAF